MLMLSLKSNLSGSNQRPKLTLAAVGQKKCDTCTYHILVCVCLVYAHISCGGQETTSYAGSRRWGQNCWQCQGLLVMHAWEGGQIRRRHGLKRQLGNEGLKAGGGSPWGRYIFHPTHKFWGVTVSCCNWSLGSFRNTE